MPDLLNFAIIGTGSIAGHFVKSISEIEGADVSAVLSSSPERADAAGKRFNIEAFSDFDKLLDEVDIDVVCICTASGNHLEPTLKSAAAGKHVLCEKPLEINTSRIDKMVRACEKGGVKLGCIFQNRFSKDFIKLQQCMEDGTLGKLVAVNAYIPWYRSDEYYGDSHWRGTLKGDGGGALINQGIHTVDLFQFIGGGISQVQGIVRTMTHDIEGEDLALANVVFESGALGQILASTAMWPGYPERLEVYGAKGSIILEAGEIKNWNIQGVPAFEKTETKSGNTGSSDPMAISHHLHRRQIEDFIWAVKNDNVPSVDGHEGRKPVALIEAIYQSSRTGEPVFL